MKFLQREHKENEINMYATKIGNRKMQSKKFNFWLAWFLCEINENMEKMNFLK